MGTVATALPPIDYPTIKVGDTTYTLKYSLLAQYVLDKAGVDVRRAPQILQSDQTGRVALMLDLFAACVAGNFVDLNQSIPTATQWAQRIPSEQFGECCQKVIAAIAKVRPAAVPGQATPAIQTGPAVN